MTASLVDATLHLQSVPCVLETNDKKKSQKSANLTFWRGLIDAHVLASSRTMTAPFLPLIFPPRRNVSYSYLPGSSNETREKDEGNQVLPLIVLISLHAGTLQSFAVPVQDEVRSMLESGENRSEERARVSPI